MERKKFTDALTVIAWVIIGIPILIYIILGYASNASADRFLSAYISILPLPDGLKTFLVKYPVVYFLAIMTPIFLLQFWSFIKEDKK